MDSYPTKIHTSMKNHSGKLNFDGYTFLCEKPCRIFYKKRLSLLLGLIVEFGIL